MDLMAVINLNEPEEQLYELTQHRPLAAVPFGGRYRLLDFILSNLVNSGITNIGILLQHKYRSLMDHLRSGKEWDLARKKDGLVFLPPASRPRNLVYGSDVENLYSNLDYILYSRQKYAVMAGSSFVCNIDLAPALDYHRQSGADITVVYTGAGCKTARGTANGAVMLTLDENNGVIDMEVDPVSADKRKMAMGMYIMERSLLIDLIQDAVSHGGYDFVKHCLIRNLDKLKVSGYLHNGYAARIFSLQSYFQHNMDLLQPAVWRELFFEGGLIYTKVKDEPPSRYTGASVRNSLVAGGCRIEGTVENSILFRGVVVEKGAQIKNSIVMQKGKIQTGAVLEQVICDKNVSIKPGRQLKGECNYPLVIKKGTVV